MKVNKEMEQKKADLLMVSVTFAWGFSYLLMKWGLNSVTPFQLIYLRFGIAFLALVVIFRKKVWIHKKEEFLYAMLLGALLFGVFACLMYGLATTKASTAAFLTGTTVVIVPILNAFVKKSVPSVNVILCIILAIAGIALLSITDQLSFEAGAWLCLADAFFLALHIIVTNRAVTVCDSLTVGVWQLGFAGLYGAIGMVTLGQTSMHLDSVGWASILGLALLCSAYGFVTQTIVQKHIAPERVGMIRTLEPVFSAALAFLILHETMTIKGMVGALLILVSIIV
jgi:drug/metabolite transporter (DMT)-like permease